MTDLNVRLTTIKLLEEKKFDLGARQKFCRYNNKSIIHIKTDQLNSIKMKNFCSLEDTIKKMKGQSTNWENICAKARIR